METVNRSFWELITDYTINIPIIQRDYAQGRIEEEEKRNKFLKVIVKHLTTNLPLDLDFIYGRIFNNIFYPIDGQQRLTTLFLLHWYISLKENIDYTTKENLVKFVYDTRISSREFCKALIEEKISIPAEAEKDNFIIEIQNNHWFRDAWRKDPTIKAMLIMIQSIHEKFNGIQDLKFWEKLIDLRIISFQVLDLGAKGFDLTDELYIKMNARGKQLTSFENFKATFIQFIENTFKNQKLQHPIKGSISYSGYFSYKIEKEWTDLFWTYRGERTVIDDMFMNYFGYIAQMCYFQSHKNALADDFENSMDQYEKIFKDKDNLLFLFQSIDKIYEIISHKGIVDKNRLTRFFDSLFPLGASDGKYNGQLRLFWNSNEVNNLFENCINNGLLDDARNKIILYALIKYLIKYDENHVTEGLKSYIRIIRNLLQSTRQRNETKYNTNVRINNFGSYWLLFEKLATEDVCQLLIEEAIEVKGTLISSDNLNYEVIKSKIIKANGMSSFLYLLEEFKYFEGLIHLLKPQENESHLKKYSSVVREIWDGRISDTLIIQALIACGFGGVYTKDCRMGEMWYFGRIGNWSTILTDNDEDVSKSIISLLNSYNSRKESSVELRLTGIVEDWINLNDEDRSWKHYFLKYPQFTSKLNYYVWPNDYEIRILGTEGSNPLVAKHISPYVLTVCELIDDENICCEEDCYQQYTGHSPLILSSGITLTCTQNGWLINNSKNSIPTKILNKFNVEQKGDKLLLKEFDSRDRIQIAIEMIKELF